MENAGAGVTRLLKNRFSEWRKRTILILAGGGNNGGDGFVIARRLMQSGARVKVLLFADAEKLKGDARLHYQVFSNCGGTIREMSQTEHMALFSSSLAHAGVIIDAVFGTGLTRPVEGLLAKAFAMVNMSDVPVLAVDIPSGVDADNGQVLGEAVKADWTVTFACEKIGHRLYPGAGLCGEIITVPIGIPQGFIDLDEHHISRNMMGDIAIPPRPADGHKGSFGHLLVVAGSVGKEGAACLTALGALRTGPGLVTVATPENARPVVAAKLTEAMTISLPLEGEGEVLAKNCVQSIIDGKIKPSALVMGPGLGIQPVNAITILEFALQWAEVPVLLDADALNLIAESGGEVDLITKRRSAPLILTPHPGEMGRLLRMTVPEIQKDRLGVARKAAQKWRAWLVLKGADTVIANPDGKVWINDSGNTGLAAGGSGDLLSGVISGLLAQQWDVEAAVRFGVWMHGAAADMAVESGSGEAGMLARDLLPLIQKLRNEPS